MNGRDEEMIQARHTSCLQSSSFGRDNQVLAWSVASSKAQGYLGQRTIAIRIPLKTASDSLESRRYGSHCFVHGDIHARGLNISEGSEGYAVGFLPTLSIETLKSRLQVNLHNRGICNLSTDNVPNYRSFVPI